MIKQREREDLFREFSRKCRLLKVQIELTCNCNLHCIHCKFDHRERNDELTIDEIKGLLPELESAGCIGVNLTGGEFFTRPDIEEMLGVFFDAGLQYGLLTNGTLINDGILDILERNRKKIQMIAVSLYAMDEKVHDSITGEKGSQRRTLNAIRMIKERGLPVRATTILMEQNYMQAGEILRFCNDAGVEYQFGALILPTGRGGLNSLKIRLTDEHLRELPIPWEELFNQDVSFPHSLFAPDQPIAGWCSMGRSGCYIDSTGEVYPCSNFAHSAGSIRRNSFRDIWQNSPLFKEIRNYRVRDFECSGCELISECLPCPALSYLEHGDVFCAPSEMCRITKTFYKGGSFSEEAIR